MCEQGQKCWACQRAASLQQCFHVVGRLNLANLQVRDLTQLYSNSADLNAVQQEAKWETSNSGTELLVPNRTSQQRTG